MIYKPEHLFDVRPLFGGWLCTTIFSEASSVNVAERSHCSVSSTTRSMWLLCVG